MSIEEQRTKIDAIDAQLVGLLNQRAGVVLEIGRLKRESHQPIVELQREHEIFARTAQNNHGPLSNGDLQRIYERIIDVMRNIQGTEITAGQPEKNPFPAESGESND